MPNRAISPISAFKLRILPWWTDACCVFLVNLFKWYPAVSADPLTVLEFGGGNSTLFFLQKGVRTVTVESDEGFIELLRGLAIQNGLKVGVTDIHAFDGTQVAGNDLTLVQASSDYNTQLKEEQCREIGNMIRSGTWSFIVNDGVARKQVMREILSSDCQSIIILDNIEYCANWGHLDTTSAKPELIKAYREILRSDNWRHLIFEQMEGRDGRRVPDVVGWEAPHRWASAILWPTSHVLNALMLSQLGYPMVNVLGRNDADLATVEQRCPFDWNTGTWVNGRFPAELDLGLERTFE